MNPPTDTKVRIDEVKPGTWTVIIPGRVTSTLVFACFFLLCWISGLALGATWALRALMQHREWMGLNLRLGLWFLAWAASGVVAMALLRRCLEISFGTEGLILQRERLRIQRVLWGRVTHRDFPMARVERFTSGRSLRFQLDGRSVSVGAALTDAEVKWLEFELNRILKEVKGC